MNERASLKLSFLGELQRRNVHRAAVFYAGAAWLLVQIATQVFPFFEIPNSTVRIVVIAAAIGFPFAMLFSWFYEWTPQGIRRESGIDRAASITKVTGKTLDKAIIAVLALAVLVLLLNQFVLHRFIASATGKPADAGDKSIAVLAFTDLSPGHDQEYFSDGIAEELLNALAKVQDLKVAGRTSSFSFKGRNQDLREIGKTLGVATILEGSVRKQGNRVRITAQLIQVKDGFHLWSETYDGELTDVFDLQEKIARAITGKLQAILEGGQQQRLVPVATSNPEAYALFLKATTVFNHRDGAHFPDAIAALQEALRLDPQFARAHARLAALYVIAPTITALDGDKLLASAEQEAQAALGLDPALAEPHAVLGMVAVARRQFLPARLELERAVTLDPKDVTANFWLATQLISCGYRTEGTARLDRVLALDPLLPNGLNWRGGQYLDAGDYVRARPMIQRSIDGGLSFGRYRLAMLAHAEGRDAEAISETTLGTRALLVGLPEDASRVFAEGFFGDAAARARALAMVDAYLAARPAVISGAIPWALFGLGEAGRALAVAQQGPTRNDALLFPRLWSLDGAAARKLPQFAEFARASGMSALWDEYGAPDDCRRVAPGDYVCQ